MRDATLVEFLPIVVHLSICNELRGVFLVDLAGCVLVANCNVLRIERAQLLPLVAPQIVLAGVLAFGHCRAAASSTRVLTVVEFAVPLSLNSEVVFLVDSVYKVVVGISADNVLHVQVWDLRIRELDIFSLKELGSSVGSADLGVREGALTVDKLCHTGLLGTVVLP